MSSNNKYIIQAAGLGAIAGLRTTFAPAIASHYLSRHPNAAISNSKLSFIQSPVTAIITKILSAGEIVGDKLPTTPDRIAFPQILGRIGSGMFVGATIYKANKQSLLTGALVGGASALAASFAAFYLRRYIDKLPHVKDAVTGAVEDVIAIGSGIALLSK
ncbi:hypothetical protein GCM10023149_42720 [Mucilaginibacter gynuensis]|uniref:DUF4126 domain-containing protein n=1 Tax=Mucilaginibacter gynuensis TaxID=1302236 RepID=A0ABP8H6B1_9SPHI